MAKISKSTDKETDNENDLKNLKVSIEKCEERYKNSFKTNMCKEIMSSWYALQAAKRKYYRYINNGEEPIKENNELINQDDYDETEDF